MAHPVSLASYRRSLVLDAVALVSIGAYGVASYRGPLPIWALFAYWVACAVAGASAGLRRRYFSLTCFVIVAVIAAHQLVVAVAHSREMQPTENSANGASRA